MSLHIARKDLSYQALCDSRESQVYLQIIESNVYVYLFPLLELPSPNVNAYTPFKYFIPILQPNCLSSQFVLSTYILMLKYFSFIYI